jgi:hypothetical protein
MSEPTDKLILSLEKAKKTRYLKACLAQHRHFVPFVASPVMGLLMLACSLQLEPTETAQVGLERWANDLNCQRVLSRNTSNSVGAAEHIPKVQK